MIKKNKSINYKEIMEFNSINEIYEFLALKEIEEFGYQNIDEFANYLVKKFKIEIEEYFGLWNQLRENYYRRNIIVHNSDKISELYVKKMKLDNSMIGQEAKLLDYEYVKKCFKNIYNCIYFIEGKFIKKFNPKQEIPKIQIEISAFFDKLF